MNKGTFYAIGIGPGDPELMTLKAINTIKKCSIIVVPKSGADTNIALKIAGDFIDKDKKIVESNMPMTKDRQLLEHYHNEASKELSTYLDKGEDVGFLTLGDPCIYSTVMYVHKKLLAMGYDTKVISGVPSFCAVAAALNMPLCEREEMVHIIPATFKGDEALNLKGTKVLMKSGKSIMEMKDKLKNKKASLVERATMEGEKVYQDLQDLEEPASYFSIIVLKD